MWTRDPFFGGCTYRNDHVTVTGYYSPAGPLEFEADCKAWTASNCPGETFTSADVAMDAADDAVAA